jgi:hypothetical protein
MRTISFILASKRIKHLGINFTKVVKDWTVKMKTLLRDFVHRKDSILCLLKQSRLLGAVGYTCNPSYLRG